MSRLPVFATFFPYTVPIHLQKDVGMIPRVLARDFGYESVFISYRNPELEAAAKAAAPELKLLQFRQNPFMKNKLLFRLFGWLDPLFIGLDLVPFMLKHAKGIDIFNSYSLRYTYIAGLIYRLFNRKGMVYCKWDKDPAFLDHYEKEPKKTDLRAIIFYLLLRFSPIDIISVESEGVCGFFKQHPLLKRVSHKLRYVPNGVDVQASDEEVDFSEKEDLILHVGRVGTRQKATEILLEAFAACKRPAGWKLVLIGEMDERFKPVLERFLEKHPSLAPYISYLGFVEKKELIDHYRKAKLLAMPSRYESFGLVVIEAGLFGDVLVGSDIRSFREITDDGKMGYLCKVDDVGCFARMLGEAMADGKGLAVRSSAMSQHVRKGYGWKKICSKIDGFLRS